MGAKQEGQKTCRKVFKVNPFTSKSQFLILYAVFCTVLRFSLRSGVEGEQCKVIIFSIGSTNNAWITYKYLAILYDYLDSCLLNTVKKTGLTGFLHLCELFQSFIIDNHLYLTFYCGCTTHKLLSNTTHLMRYKSDGGEKISCILLYCWCRILHRILHTWKKFLDRIFPYTISTISSRQIMRIKKNIN